MAVLPALRLQAKYFPDRDFLHGAAFVPVAGRPQDVWDNGSELTAEIFCIADWIGIVTCFLCEFYHDAVIIPDTSPVTTCCKM